MRNKREGEVVAWWWLRGGGPHEVHAILVGEDDEKNWEKNVWKGYGPLVPGGEGELGQRDGMQARERWAAGREGRWARRGEWPKRKGFC
jgi:hypothetical protein